MRFGCTANLNSPRSVNCSRKTLEAIVFYEVLLTSTSSPLPSKFQKAIIRGDRATREPPIAPQRVCRTRWRSLELAKGCVIGYPWLIKTCDAFRICDEKKPMIAFVGWNTDCSMAAGITIFWRVPAIEPAA
jgi:hypothetical protein